MHVKDFIEHYTPKEVAAIERRLTPLQRFHNQISNQRLSMSCSDRSIFRDPINRLAHNESRSFNLNLCRSSKRPYSPPSVSTNILDN